MKELIQILSAFLGSLGFAMVFGLNKKYWLLVSIDGMLSWIVYLLCRLVMNSFFANLVSSAFCSLYAHVASRIRKVPTTCLLTPGSVPMIPGGSLYYTMSYAISGNYIACKKYMFSTIETMLGMAIGFAVIALFFKIITTPRKSNV